MPTRCSPTKADARIPRDQYLDWLDRVREGSVNEGLHHITLRRRADWRDLQPPPRSLTRAAAGRASWARRHFDWRTSHSSRETGPDWRTHKQRLEASHVYPEHFRNVAGSSFGPAKNCGNEGGGETIMTAPAGSPDLILHRGLFTTLDPSNPIASAVAIKDGVFSAVGRDEDVMPLAVPTTRVVDLKGRRALPGLIDNHLHIIRGGLNFNMELRWDGVRTLADAMAMLKRQVAITPPPQWVRVVGGFTEHQFAEKRLPTIAELNEVAPDTPVFLLHLYDRALLNGAALRAVGYTKDTPNPPGGEILRDARGNPTGLLLAQPNAGILYATLAKGPKLSREDQLNSSRLFFRELNRFGITSAIDAGGGFQNYPDDYGVVNELHRNGDLSIRLAYNLFTQKPKQELSDFQNWTKMTKPGDGDDFYRVNGAGEMLVFSAADFEDFLVARPDMPPVM